MAVLNDFQKITRVLSGQPWADGADGSATVAADPNTRATITGTATQTTGTAGSTAFANGDLVILHQTQGTGAGQWEVNKVASGGGSTSLTFQVAHHYTYGTGAQIIKVPRYTTSTVEAHSVTAWNGTTGGVEVICAKTSITVSGALNGVGLGFRGSAGNHAAQVIQGEGTVGVGSGSTAANGNGSGGSSHDSSINAGSAGGHAANGGQGDNDADGVPGGIVGSSDLIDMNLGGAGAGAYTHLGSMTGSTIGGAGGAIFIFISKSVILSSTVSVTGQVAVGEQGESSTSRKTTAGSGAGGSILIISETSTLGTNQATSLGGASDTASGAEPFSGGAGSVGRIAVHHSGTVTGTTSPTFTDVADASLVEATPRIEEMNYAFFM